MFEQIFIKQAHVHESSAIKGIYGNRQPYFYFLHVLFASVPAQLQ